MQLLGEKEHSQQRIAAANYLFSLFARAMNAPSFADEFNSVALERGQRSLLNQL
jgi:hypothetical protein